MPNAFEKATQWMIEQNQKRLGVNIVYRRGNSNVTLIKKAWKGRTPFRVSDREGSRLIWSECDFLIPTANLILNGTLVTPETGDVIEEFFPNVEGTQTFELMAPNDEPVWRYSDPQRMIYRIHTKPFRLT